MVTRSLSRRPVSRQINPIRDPEQREELVDHLVHLRLMKPQDAVAITDSLTIAERTILDIEMRQRSRAGHTSDYDPMKQAYEGY